MKTKVTLVGFVVVAMVLSSMGTVLAKEWEYVPKIKDFRFLFGGGTPILKIKAGDRVKLWTEDAGQGLVKSKEDTFSKALAPIWPAVNPQTGPIYVEGAEPGDTLVLKVVNIEPAVDQAWSMIIPNFGFLTQTRFTSMLHEPHPANVWKGIVSHYTAFENGLAGWKKNPIVSFSVGFDCCSIV